MLGLSARESCRGPFKRLKILTVPCTYFFYCLMYTKKNLRELKIGSNLHSYNTRNKQLLVAPRTRLTKTYNSYLSQGIKCYNMLPSEIKDLSLVNFKRIIKKFSSCVRAIPGLKQNHILHIQISNIFNPIQGPIINFTLMVWYDRLVNVICEM